MYEHYREHIRAGANADAIKSITKLLSKEKFTKEQLIEFIEHYRHSPDFPADKQYRVQANNFFGQRRRFEDFTQKVVDSGGGGVPDTYYSNLEIQ